jgi:hypothetical protein
LYSSPNTIIKVKKDEFGRNPEHKGENELVYNFGKGQKEGDNWEDLSIDGNTILKRQSCFCA